MREVLVSRHDIDRLAESIGALDLSDSQRSLLSGIVAVIGELIKASDSSVDKLVLRVADQQELVVVAVDDQSPSLHVQIRGAFTPGALGRHPAGGSKIGERVVRASGPKIGEGVVRASGPKIGEGVLNQARRGRGGVSAKKGWPASRHPDDDIDLLAANAVANSHPNFTYQGGHVLSNPKVYTSYWGPAWENDPGHQQLRQQLDQFVQDFLVSNYMNILSQYGVGSGPGKTGTYVDPSSIDPAVNGVLTDANIHTKIQDLINAKKLPEPESSRDSVALIFLDDGVAISDAKLGIVMCEPTSDTAFGYHYFFTTLAGHRFYYAIIPGLSDTCLRESCPDNDPRCSLDLSKTTVLQRVTQVTSHEYAEMLTDPEINAWRDPSNGAEIGDICNGESANITVSKRLWTVQKMYSYYDDINGGQPGVVSAPSPLPNLLMPYQQFILRTGTPLRQAEAGGCNFAVGDYTGTGRPDLFCVKTDTESGSIQVDVLSGASNYQQFVLRTATPLQAEAGDCVFAVGDYTGTGIPDLFCVKKPDTRSGSIEVDVLSGASNYQQFVLRTGTPLRGAEAGDCVFAVGDYTGTGRPDLFCVKKPDTGSGSIEVHVLSGASYAQ